MQGDASERSEIAGDARSGKNSPIHFRVLLNLNTPLKSNDIKTLTGYTKTYGVPTDLGIQAVHLLAQTESIILDPTYTAKSMSALISEIQNGNQNPKTPTIFIHSGGLPQTFAFATEI